MLMRELRRDYISARESVTPTAPPEDQLDEPTLEESLSWTDHLKMYYVEAVTWYHSQSDDTKNLLKVLGLILFLYVAFGGRFGLDQLFSGSQQENRGNYEAGNAYDRYYNRQTSHDSSHHSANHRQTSDESDYEYRPRYQSSRGGGGSFHFPNLMDGSPQSMLCLAGIAYLCYRNGINPFQVIMMINMMAGHRHGRGMGMHGYGMGYGGMGGGGFGGGGFRRNRWR